MLPQGKSKPWPAGHREAFGCWSSRTRCYPRTVLGLPPDWYKSRNYRSRAVSEPRAVLQEFGTALPDEVAVRVHDSNADMRYLVLPMRPAGTEGWSEDRLAALVTRDCMVGVTVPKPEKVPA